MPSSPSVSPKAKRVEPLPVSHCTVGEIFKNLNGCLRVQLGELRMGGPTPLVRIFRLGVGCAPTQAALREKLHQDATVSTVKLLCAVRSLSTAYRGVGILYRSRLRRSQTCQP